MGFLLGFGDLVGLQGDFMGLFSKLSRTSMGFHAMLFDLIRDMFDGDLL